TAGGKAGQSLRPTSLRGMHPPGISIVKPARVHVDSRHSRGWNHRTIADGGVMKTARCMFLAAACLFFLVAGSTESVAGAVPGKGAGIPIRIEILPGVHEKWIDPILA